MRNPPDVFELEQSAACTLIRYQRDSLAVYLT